jgi:hypothetical protein
MNAGMVTSGHGLSHTFKGTGMAANGLTGIKSELALHYQLMQNTLWF